MYPELCRLMLSGKLEQLLFELEKEIQSWEMCAYMTNTTAPKRNENRTDPLNKGNNFNFKNDEEVTAATLYAGRSTNFSCTYCRRGHQNAQCTVIQGWK